MKNICIIGGGSAGLAMDIGLKKLGLKSTVCERLGKWGAGVLGFILLPNGLSALDQLGVGEEARASGFHIREFIMRSQVGTELIREELPAAFGIKRNKFLNVLRHLAPPSSLRTGLNFSHFEYDESGKAVAAHFDNGERLEADLFFGCDGVRSVVRSELFPQHPYPKFRVKEMTCLVHAPDIAAEIGPTFIKTQHEEGGLAFGIVPIGSGDLIWYLQFDSERWDFSGVGAKEKKEFASSLVGHWAEPIPTLLERSDFRHAPVWTMTDMDPLPSYYRKNVALIGDAAHIFLPFTSQGVNSALHDSVFLAEELGRAARQGDRLEEALESYNNQHKNMVKRYVKSGRDLAERFLFPRKFGNERVIPFSK